MNEPGPTPGKNREYAPFELEVALAPADLAECRRARHQAQPIFAEALVAAAL